MPALQTAAVAVRGALTSFRETQEAGGKVLQLIAALQAAPTSVMVSCASQGKDTPFSRSKLQGRCPISVTCILTTFPALCVEPLRTETPT